MKYYQIEVKLKHHDNLLYNYNEDKFGRDGSNNTSYANKSDAEQDLIRARQAWNDDDEIRVEEVIIDDDEL